MISDLTDTEIDSICDGYVQNSAKIRFLRSMGLTVRAKPNGRPLVNRAHYDAIMGCGANRQAENSNHQPRWGVH